MDNVISAQELKRRGISAVDTALREGPVHIIRRNQPSYVILSEAGYQELVGRHEAAERLWDRLLAAAGPGSRPGARSAREIRAQVEGERGSWESP